MGWVWRKAPSAGKEAILVPPEAIELPWQKLQGDEKRYTDFRNIPRFSDDTGWAMKVAQHVAPSKEDRFTLTWRDGVWDANFELQRGWTPGAIGRFPAEAICRAALLSAMPELVDRNPR